MKAGERLRVRFVFLALGLVPVLLVGRLGFLQVLQAGELPRSTAPLPLVTSTADRQSARSESVPAPRGSIVDRNGNLLAVDREVYEVRARISVPRKSQETVASYLTYLAELVDDLARAMVADPQLANRSEAEQVHREQFAARLRKAFRTAGLGDIADPAAAKLPAAQECSVEIQLLSNLDELPAVEALRALDEDSSSVALDFLRRHERSYPERALTYGFVGHVETVDRAPAGSRTPIYEVVGKAGLEALDELDAGSAAARDFKVDGRGRPYFQAPIVGSGKPSVVHSTLDLELQRIAQRELAAKAEAGTREDPTKRPMWGAMILVEVATGDVLAAASWHRGGKDPKAASWTPYQQIYEPGSIVKPLVFAYALEAGRLDWDQSYDCAPGSSEYRERIGSLGRRNSVKDDHDCHVLTPHGILVNSSNIGAAYVGLQLDRDQWRDYMRFYGFGTSLGLGIPNGSRGGTNPRSFAPEVPVRSFRANSAISFSFGYEMQATAFHIARAYLRLFRGDGSELRVTRGVEVDGQWRAAPVSPSGAKFSPHVIDAVRAAMVDVVSADEHATGSHLHRAMLKEQGIDLHGIVGGKTGTAVSHVGVPGRGKVEMRNASFVGFLPVEDPRWLAVCVMQNDERALFYGGSYAAPPAVRLLLQAQRLHERRQLRQELQDGPDGQVRARQTTPGDSGWGRGAPETTSVGR